MFGKETKNIEVKDNDSVEESKEKVEEVAVEEGKEVGVEEKPEAKTEFIKVDPVLQEILTKAFRSKRYLICISRLEGDKLSHDYSTNDFKKGDIAPSLDIWADLLAKEMQN